MSVKIWEIEVPEKGSGGEDFVLPPVGNHPAVCVAVIDLGTQRRLKYQSQETEDVRMVYLCWELVDVEGSPVVGREFRVSLHEKSGLRHFVDSWTGAKKDGERFNIFTLSGKPCLLDIKHAESRDGTRTYSKIEGAAALPRVKGKLMEISPPTHEPVALKLAERDGLPNWVPYSFGKSIAKVMSDALELRGKADDSDEYVPDEEEEKIPY